MGIHTKSADDIQEVDVIIAGGGTAGCVVAARLAEADPTLSILVIEGGRNNHNDPLVVNPAPFLALLQPATKAALFYKGNKAPQLADREPIVPSGGILGGGSSINFMMYTRAQRPDFDAWKMPGWSTDEVLPYMKKLETYHGKGDEAVHGYDGPVHITDGGYRGESEADFRTAAKSLGMRDFQDLQDLDSCDGYAPWLRTVSKEGKRQDAAHVYLHPKLQDGAKYPNLHVVVEAQVVRVLFDEDKKAVGVEYRANPEFQATIALSEAPVRSVRARRMVVVSCGALGTPSVLERSGVGAPEVLERAGVPLVADVPGVGHDYQDHHLVLYPYQTGLRPDETIDAMLAGRGRDLDTMLKNKDEMLSWNTIDFGSKIRPSEDEVTALGPEFREAWDRDFKNAPSRPLMLMATVMCFLGDPSTVPEGQYVTTGTYTAYPYSRGHIHITGPQVSDPLDFDVGFFSDAHDVDLKKQMWAYKKQREFMRRTKLYRGELAAGHPKFPAGSKAACVETKQAPEANDVVTDIEYTADDDAAIEQHLRENVNTTWHSLGTCKMAPRERMGVVDADLSVYGVRNLKLADLSVAPENVGANTNNTAFTIGEKAAAIFIKELGLA
ncbi:GMC oxidoreductase [Apiospora kogelbergensis]|uniref:GMC oxidoreductase n=1 Tax=Apiospora kogelbergensis TaxID=1337665 RepID=A0AAW0REB9_9PEZI